MSRGVTEGVALFLMNVHGQIFLVKELNDKRHVGKIAGMLSIPMETVRDDELPRDAILRLIEEEVGARVQGDPTFVGSIMFEPDPRLQIIGYTIHVFVAHINPVTEPNPGDSEDVAAYGWRDKGWLLNPPHPGCFRREIPRLVRMITN